VPTREALGKDFLFFKKKNLCRVPTRGARQRFFIFFIRGKPTTS